MDNYGNVSYVGSGTPKSVKVGGDAYVNQNFAGQDVFENIIFENEKFSIFELADDYIESLKVDLSSSRSENLFSDGTSVDVVFPSTGDEATVSFVLDTGSSRIHAISAKVYGNDYSVIATEINKLTASIGLSASIVDGNRIRLQDASGELYMEKFVVSNVIAGGAEVKVIKDTSSSNV